MTDESKLKSLAQQLIHELKQANTPDTKALELLRDLDSNLQDVVERTRASNEIVDLLTNLESRFAVSHPVAERTLRDLIDVLNKMGI
ncbi:DUF4404 family protein [Teredinibacter purpureus]|uniref:DUF4404 family protein n=1 Tax=Teredinibacter purpureus TaxID=2731756 RepID=UPI0005F7D5A3|nr:DUF4404 family protein [Teredinibacter purpureus]